MSTDQRETDALIEAHLAQARTTIIAALTRQFRSVERAEDGYQEASVRAWLDWRKNGIPRHPEGWLVRAGRNALIDHLRKEQSLNRTAETAGVETMMLASTPEDAESELVESLDRDTLRDDILRLLFMCCHDELSQADQLALALRVVGGFSNDHIARAFVVRPKAMEQRLTRARKRAAATATMLQTPSLAERTGRLNAVARMVYLLFNEGYSATGGDRHIKAEIAVEAIRLARLLLTLFPGQAELMGLLALFLYQHARREARIDEDGQLIALDKQDRLKWIVSEIQEADILAEKALRHGRPGSYQIQAAIAGIHCRAQSADQTEWEEIAYLYGRLEVLEPSPVIALNRAVAISKTHGPEAALEVIDPLSSRLSSYMYFHSTRASLLAQIGRKEAAVEAWNAAIGCGPNEAELAYITGEIEKISK